MGYRKGRVSELARGVEDALAALEVSVDTAALDAWLDPAQAAACLAATDGEVTLMRAAPALEEAGETHSSTPRDAFWLALAPSGDKLSWCSLRDAALEQGEATALRIELNTESCCDANKCKDDKVSGRLWVDIDEDRSLVVAEHISADSASLRERLLMVARPLAKRLDVPIEGVDSSEVDAEGDLQSAPTEPPLSARQLARWALRREGEHFVLRDHASRGPREAAPREFAVLAAFVLAGVAAWYGVSQAWAEQNYELLAIVGAIAVVFTLASWAMSHIAIFSSKYRARTEALLYMARDRFVVAPWVSRAGAIDIKLEGRFGKAIPIEEIEALDVEEDGDAFSLMIRTRDHGPFSLGSLESEAEARAWQRALARLVEGTAHHRPAGDKARSAGLAAVLVSGAIALLGLGCGPAPVTPEVEMGTTAVAAPVPTVSEGQPAGSSAPAVASAPKLKLIEDDVDGAMAKARGEGKAVFVEVWAPWCHTCLSMKSFVLPDPAIVALQQRVVFAAVDSDRPDNSAFVARYAVNVWPTLYVLDAKDGTVLGLWQGAASVEELRTFINGSVDARDVALDPKAPLGALQQAKRAHGSAKYIEAARFYRQAFERGGKDWPRRSEALHGLLFSEYKMAHWERCAALGAEHVDSIEGAAGPTDFAWVVLSCAKKIKDKALASKARKRTLARMQRHTAAPPAASSVDDRADALSLYSDMLASEGARPRARAALVKQIVLLEKAADNAPSPEAAATFDYQRMNSYLALGRGDAAVKMLQARRKQMPDSYEPPARLAQALVALKRLPEAREAIGDALSKSYGARKLRYFALAAAIHGGLGDVAKRRESLEGLIATFDGLDEARRKDPRNKDQADEARAALRQLEGKLKRK
jgi:thioredoxin-like negative regulator of GroEL